MLSRNLYYIIKPMVPRRVRTTVRHHLAIRQRERVGTVWPILPGSERAPAGWPGWPEGKQFAFVSTHDVEGRQGVDRCRQLMQLEQEAGFISSFNFVPEGTYAVAPDLREELVEKGFEVGVHDLNHDGKLYSSYRSFKEKAHRINDYLKQWGAAGFRSGFMLHNLEWAHHLNVDYEASTFDTDPFEPQPDGVGTIFPFWVPRPPSFHGGNSNPGTGAPRGYVELPYTLPQDSTVFLVLADRNPDVWFRKLDWVAEHGGMVLVNTHPDYMAMNGSESGHWEYPVSLYQQLMERISSRYAGLYWHALPREVAAYWRRTMVDGETGALENREQTTGATRA